MHGKGSSFAIFDADQVPKRDFIVKLLPYMQNEKLAMVQSPQYFANPESFIAAGTAQAQRCFKITFVQQKHFEFGVLCWNKYDISSKRYQSEIGRYCSPTILKISGHPFFFMSMDGIRSL